ncbi:hypothetical protein ACF3MZ_26390 [Paenibacillaceae bacterium WGS1546]|uniref:hypothetical protein n=1 Tax=Cohnella sp. WGS1546 TaxID=3366810 RepID=UPI00372D505D
MKKALVLILAMPLFLVACSSSNQHTLQSWAFYVVTWNHEVYKITNEAVTEIDDEIGTIKIHSTKESSELPNLFSNKYKKGTKLFKIKNVETNDYIAIQDDGKYYKAEKMEGMKTAAD